MTKRAVATAGVFLLLAATSVFGVGRTDTSMAETAVTDSSNEVIPLSTTERTRARAWGLSKTEWRRYQQLMQGIRGSVSPSTISPLEVLGIHSRDETERERYAEAWAQTMYEDAERILAFQHAYDAALKRLYPNEPLINTKRLPEKTAAANPLQPADRLLFFTRPACGVCDVLLDKLLQRIHEVGGIDIYLTDITPGDDVAVREWALTHRIDPDWVRSGKITLNHDGGALHSLTNEQSEVPYLLRRRGADLSPLRASDL